jgi:adenine-specific DNA-methyltransferase
MRSELDILLDKVADPVLRSDIRSQAERLRAKRTFGLVFESHIPERVRLPEHPIRTGVKVVKKDQQHSPTFEVRSIDESTVTLRKVRNPDGSFLTASELEGATNETVHLKDLVVIADFGEPIYPGLRYLDSITQGDNKPFQIVIKGENHHVLEALQFTHSGKVDCIYIDPPYNGGARDWKYDNNYVDENDAYRHSKWLAYMERRLRLAKQLLKPDESVLIVTIDEKEFLRLGLLLEQLFPAQTIQMVTIVINPKGTARYNEFSRVEEYAFFVFLGSARLQSTGSDMLTTRDYASETDVRWRGLARTGRKGLRSNNPGSWYPIFINTSDLTLHSIGDAITTNIKQNSVRTPRGTIAVWPPEKNGHQYSWSVVPETLRAIHAKGGFKIGRINQKRKSFPFYYLSSNTFEKIERGEIVVVGRGPTNELIVEYAVGLKSAAPRSVWNQVAHDAGSHGTALLERLIPGRKFPFPKSLYAVEDAIRFFLKDKPEAVVLDFFGGSGTTTHAVARLNRQDGGRRQSILVTNNEVSASEAEMLREQGLRPGDVEWEALGIFEQITRPRVKAAITGRTPEGEPIKGSYKFIDKFPMAEGFGENVVFFELTYLDPEEVELDEAFIAVDPLLWMRAGGRGRLLSDGPKDHEQRGDFAWADTYGVLFNPDRWRSFIRKRGETVLTAYVVTDSQTTFAGVASELPGFLDVVRLYENYLTTFGINRAYL